MSCEVPSKTSCHFAESWIHRYFELLRNADSDAEQSEALKLKRANFPKTLYRYRSLDRLAYPLDELRKGYVYLCDPSKFNDPYDSALSTSLATFFSQTLEPYGYGDPSIVSDAIGSLSQMETNSFLALFYGFFSTLYGSNSWDPKNRDIFDAVRNLVRVARFNTNPHSVVMWSHYANQHKGVCFEFDGAAILSSTTVVDLVHPVLYAKQLFDLTQIFSPLTEQGQNAFFPIRAIILRKRRPIRARHKA
jgi:Protein of unknown function (DUF2971)